MVVVEVEENNMAQRAGWDKSNRVLSDNVHQDLVGTVLGSTVVHIQAVA